MIWTNEVPWHGLGIEMDPAAGAMAWMTAAGLDWDVVKQPMFTTMPNGENITVKGKKGSDYSVLIRDHRNNEFAPEDIFGPVGPEWIPVQNSEVFLFMERFCDANGMTIETCGSLKGGTEIWALLKFADEFEVVKGDPMKGYLLFRSCHVWGKGNQLLLTPVRVVCNNTMTAALSNNSGNFKMPHTTEFTTEVQDNAIQALGLAQGQMDEFQTAAQLLSDSPCNDAQLQQFITEIFQPNLFGKMEQDNIPVTEMADHWTPTAEGVYQSVHLSPGADLKSAKGTWWGALNGVTYYEDHMRVSFQDDSNTLGSAWFGGGAKRKQEAMVLATKMAVDA
tara:strand:- start:2173 stop:3177 length:1005 start_codon:yes stop_codon:yes gene_type:complete